VIKSHTMRCPACQADNPARARASAGRAATASGDAFLAWPRVQAALQDLERIRRA